MHMSDVDSSNKGYYDSVLMHKGYLANILYCSQICDEESYLKQWKSKESLILSTELLKSSL